MTKEIDKKTDKNILLEIWKTCNYIDLIGSFLLLPSLILLWYLNYKIGFCILLVLIIITKLGFGIKINKLERKLI